MNANAEGGLPGNRPRLARRLFGSLPGLVFLAVAWDALLVASLSPFSGPLRPLGLAGRLAVDLGEATRAGRIIMLYHSLAVPFVAALVYLVLDQLPMGPPEEEGRVRRSIVVPVTAGYMLTSLGGMTYGYGGRSPIAHGLYLAGLSLVFYAGVLLAVALWPSRRWAGDPGRHAHLGRLPLERLAFFLVAVFTLVSAAIGGAAGAFFGSGFVAFLAEDIVRQSPHTLFQLMIIAHLHIMLTLIDVMILLLVIRTYRLEGWAHRIAIPLTLVGTVIVTLATWSVIAWEGAHKIINVGSAFLLPGALVVAIWGLVKLIRDELGCEPAGPGRRCRALLRDPVRFGVFFELAFVNLVVTIPGVYVAFHLDTYRLPAWLEVERAILAGHWHVLATLSAVIVLLLAVDRLGVQGRLRRLVGWGLLLGSTLAFAFVNVYLFRRPGQVRAWTVPLFEAGIAVCLLVLAVFVAAQLVRSTVTRD